MSEKSSSSESQSRGDTGSLEPWHQTKSNYADLPEQDQKELEKLFAKYDHSQLMAIRDMIVALGQQRSMRSAMVAREQREYDWHYCPPYCEICWGPMQGPTR